MFKRKVLPIVTRKTHEAVIVERDEAKTELERWRDLANVFQCFLDGKETLGAIRGRLNILITTVDIKNRKERSAEPGGGSSN